MKQGSKPRSERSWVEICCFGCSCLQLLWPRVVMRKLLNIDPRDSDYSADTDDEEDIDLDYDTKEFFERSNDVGSRFRGIREEDPQRDLIDGLPRSSRRNSETFRAQYISTKELRICVGTWNVGGKVPPDDLDIDDWLSINESADIYVLGFQELVPLHAGNIFGAEDNSPVPKWENIIRETLDRIRPATTKVKCYSDPSSPTKFKPFDDVPKLEEEIILRSERDIGEEIYPLDEDPNGFDEVNNSTESKRVFSSCGVSCSNDATKFCTDVEQDLKRQFSSPKMLDGLYCLRTQDCAENVEDSACQQNRKLTRMLSGTERIGLSCQGPPLYFLSQNILDRPSSFRATKSFRAYSSFKSINDMGHRSSGIALLAELDLETLTKRKRRSSYVRIVSKQMVGIFLTIWVRRSLRRHIQNLKVSTVGVGVMGYIGNKLVQELQKGRIFDGWSEGAINFAPTYKYELNSDKYYGEDPKVGRRTPAWCDRILFYGRGMRQLRYSRTELKLSDHRPVSAVYMAEVEVFCPRRLQRALTY
ncbi:DNAse I-like superfamily protein isoform 2 [Hibiscus syriacus]|uniref:DNAse I-like superfamily protein isoform 2 n=1 Tax=Hibiscus syriacus TaxID=106335 RepID=A0A6A3CGD4_HIBSY|nr:DNAse I-like superfamily protein isoform 2 [Hibiscus syriacus]